MFYKSVNSINRVRTSINIFMSMNNNIDKTKYLLTIILISLVNNINRVMSVWIHQIIWKVGKWEPNRAHFRNLHPSIWIHIAPNRPMSKTSECLLNCSKMFCVCVWHCGICGKKFQLLIYFLNLRLQSYLAWGLMWALSLMNSIFLAPHKTYSGRFCMKSWRWNVDLFKSKHVHDFRHVLGLRLGEQFSIQRSGIFGG